VRGGGRRWTIGIALAIVAGAAAALPFLRPSAPSQPAGTARPGLSTAEVTRSTLAETRTVSGTLGYGQPISVRSRNSAGAGIITWMAAEGAVVERGEPLFAVDGRPAIVIYGDAPFFRTLRFDSGSFDDFEWIELNMARTDKREAELSVALERARLKEAESRLADARARLADSEREPPRTPQLIQLNAAVRSAADDLERARELARSGVTSAVDLQAAEYALAVARATLDAVVTELRERFESAESRLLEAQLAVLRAERADTEARDRLDALRSMANERSDVALLEDNLSALGYTGSASEAVRAWQADLERDASGLIEPGLIVVTDGPVRVAEQLVDVGNTAPSNIVEQGFVLRYTGTEKLVTMLLEFSDLAFVRVEHEVTVTLPDGDKVRGVISDIGTSLTAQGQTEAVVKIPDQRALGVLEAASVDVEFVTVRRRDVLAVPVTALLALPEGGYGVEVVDGRTVRTVAVSTGMFAGGRVEISGEDIVEGMRVALP
jgi:multidrug efflux pump subunit AcrA (membrane-fusion protein)